MSKKYLLYIHNDHRFDLESEKSRLVNQLLEQHYGKPSTETLPARSSRAHVISTTAKEQSWDLSTTSVGSQPQKSRTALTQGVEKSSTNPNDYNLNPNMVGQGFFKDAAIADAPPQPADSPAPVLNPGNAWMDKIRAGLLERQRVDKGEPITVPTPLRTLSHPQLMWLVRETMVDFWNLKHEAVKAADYLESNHKPISDGLAYLVKWVLRARDAGRLEYTKAENGSWPVGEWSNGDGTTTIATGTGKNRRELTYTDEDLIDLANKEAIA